MVTRYRSMYLGSQGKLCNWNISRAFRTLIVVPRGHIAPGFIDSFLFFIAFYLIIMISLHFWIT